MTNEELLDAWPGVRIDHDNLALYRGLLDQLLLVNRCGHCAHWHHPPSSGLPQVLVVWGIADRGQRRRLRCHRHHPPPRRGEQVGSGRVEQTEPFVFSADETCDIGFVAGTPVFADYAAEKGRFNGEVNWVEIDVGDAANDNGHYTTEVERYRVTIPIR